MTVPKTFLRPFANLWRAIPLRRSFLLHLFVAAVIAAALSVGTLVLLSFGMQKLYDETHNPMMPSIYDEAHGSFISAKDVNVSQSEDEFVPVVLPAGICKSLPVDDIRGADNANVLIYGDLLSLPESMESDDQNQNVLALGPGANPLPPYQGYTVREVMDEFQQTMWEEFVQVLNRYPESNFSQSYRSVLGATPRTVAEARRLFSETFGDPMAAPFEFFSTSYYTSDDLHLAEGLKIGAYWLIVLWFVLCFLVAGNRFYRSRLAKPLAQLENAAERIAQENLDFTVDYRRSDEMGRLATSFETMRASLEVSQRQLWQAAEDQRQLNSAFAHDLRTPLAVLRGRLEMLEACAANEELSPEKLAAACERLLAQVQRLEDYVDMMARLQRLDERPVHLAPVSLDQLESDLSFLADTLGKASGKTVEVSLEGDVDTSPLFLDEPLVLEVAENLLTNALRYARNRVEVAIVSPSGDMHEAPVKPLPSDGQPANFLQIQVRDDGPGFSPQALANARHPFFSEACDNGHLGVGLNTASTLCERHGGSLELQNSSEEGSLAIAIFHADER